MAEKLCNLVKSGGGALTKSVRNAQVNVASGTNTNVTLTNNLKKDSLIYIALTSGTLTAQAQTISYADFTGDFSTVRIAYFDGSAVYMIDVTYISDSQINVHTQSMPAGAVLSIDVKSYVA